jgi:hypothetical protein
MGRPKPDIYVEGMAGIPNGVNPWLMEAVPLLPISK